MYGHVITKFSRMGSLPHFLTHGAPLRASRARAPLKIPGKNFTNFGIPRQIVLVFGDFGKCCSVRYWKLPENSNRTFWLNRKRPKFRTGKFPELRLPSKLHKTVPFNENGRESPETVIKIGFEEMEHKYLYHSVKMFRCPLKFSTRTTRKLVPYVRTSKTHGVT